MDFAMLPPEVNSGLMYSGAGVGPMLAAATAWDALASELHSARTGHESVITELGSGWSGPSWAAMAGAAAPYVTWMHATAVQAEQAALQARTAAAAYETAFAMTVPPPVIAANRAQLMTLLATNFLGQNTPAIAATEAHYAEMWAQDATAMYNYAGSAAAASVLEPFSPPPRATNPAGSTSQAATAGQAATSAAGQLAGGPHALQGLTAPGAAAAGSSSNSSGILSASGSGAALASDIEALLVELVSVFVVDSIGTFVVDAIGTFVIDAAGALIGAWEAGLLPIAGLAGMATPVLASTGQAAMIGGMSVPTAWTVASTEAVKQAGTALTAATAKAGPGIGALPFAGMATAGLAGSAMAGRGDRSTTSTRKQSSQTKPSQKASASGPATAVAGKLRHLVKLREAGILTDAGFAEKKRRLLDPRPSA